MAEQELKLIAVAKEFDKAAGEVRKVSDAEKQLADDVLKSGTASKEATEAGRKIVDAYEKQTKATDKAKFATSDLTSVLSRIHPQLGALVDGLLKSGNIAGQLASQNITLSGTFDKATKAIQANAAALKLIGAGGLVVLAILAIVKAFEKMKEEADRATAALNRQRDALNDLRKAQQEQQQSIEDVSDKRRIGGLTPEAAAEAARVAESIGKRFPQLAPESINQAVGNLGDIGLSREQLTQASILAQIGRLDIDPRGSAESLKAAFERSLRHNLDAVAKFLERESTQHGAARVVPEAMRQAHGVESETLAIQEIIRQMPAESTLGLDPGEIARVVQGLRSTGGGKPNILSLKFLFDTIFSGDHNLGTLLFAGDAKNKAQAIKDRGGVVGASGEPVSPELIHTAELVLEKLDRAAEKLKEAADRSANSPTVNDNRMFNPRFFAPDKASQDRLIRNGESRADGRG